MQKEGLRAVRLVSHCMKNTKTEREQDWQGQEQVFPARAEPEVKQTCQHTGQPRKRTAINHTLVKDNFISLVLRVSVCRNQEMGVKRVHGKPNSADDQISQDTKDDYFHS